MLQVSSGYLNFVNSPMRVMLWVGFMWIAILDQSVGIVLSEKNRGKYKLHIRWLPGTYNFKWFIHNSF